MRRNPTALRNSSVNSKRSRLTRVLWASRAGQVELARGNAASSRSSSPVSLAAASKSRLPAPSCQAGSDEAASPGDVPCFFSPRPAAQSQGSSDAIQLTDADEQAKAL